MSEKLPDPSKQLLALDEQEQADEILAHVYAELKPRAPVWQDESIEDACDEDYIDAGDTLN